MKPRLISQGENKLNVSLKYTTLTRARKKVIFLVGSDVTYHHLNIWKMENQLDLMLI